MATETVSAVTTIKAPAATVFAVLAHPTNHAAIDGTGWVREPLDEQQRLTEAGQIFRMAMYHDNHPDGHYEMANQVRVFDPPHAVSWEPGQDAAGDGNLEFGGWIWRYDLTPVSSSETEVTLSYDWSAVPECLREHIQFPPFNSSHLDNSLSNLAGIAVALTSPLDTLPKVDAPATRALTNAGYTSLGQLAGVHRSELAKLHGIGPRALRTIEDHLERHGLELG